MRQLMNYTINEKNMTYSLPKRDHDSCTYPLLKKTFFKTCF